jgi:hypothetical protein
MKYRLVPLSEEWLPAVRACNERMRRSGTVPFYLPESCVPEANTSPIRKQHWLAVGDDDEVHGGCLLQTQPAWAGGKETEAVNIQSPLSEASANRQHAPVALWMLKEIERICPLAYSVGMGSEQAPYARLLKALRWRVETVPFFFRVLSGRRLLGHLQPLRMHRTFGPVARIASHVPLLPELAIAAAHRFRSSVSRRVDDAAREPDWQTIRTRYGFAVDRSEEVLAALYGPAERFHRVRSPGALGILALTDCRGHRYFGDLRVATLAEMICWPGAEEALLAEAVRQAQTNAADLLVTNQSAPDLTAALKRAGWFAYTSNYVVAYSRALTSEIGIAPAYVTRGDGDGLLNL